MGQRLPHLKLPPNSYVPPYFCFGRQNSASIQISAFIVSLDFCDCIITSIVIVSIGPSLNCAMTQDLRHCAIRRCKRLHRVSIIGRLLEFTASLELSSLAMIFKVPGPGSHQSRISPSPIVQLPPPE